MDGLCVYWELALVARDTNSKSSYSSSCSFGIKVRPETVGSEINTPLPYLLAYHATAAFGSFGKHTNSTSAGFRK